MNAPLRPVLVVPAEDLPGRLADLLERAARGERVLVTHDGAPLAELGPPEAAAGEAEAPAPYDPKADTPLPRIGALRGHIWMADDFDAPLPPDIQAYFDGEIDDFTDEPIVPGKGLGW